MSASIITHRLGRLVEQLGDLRIRLKQAARFEVAQAIGDTLAESAKLLICGSARMPRMPHETMDADPWDDPWHDPFAERSSWSDDPADEAASDEPQHRQLHTRSALLTGFAVARWSLMRTGQPTVAIGLAGLAAIVVLLAGDRIAPLLDACAAAHELIEYPKRRS